MFVNEYSFSGELINTHTINASNNAVLVEYYNNVYIVWSIWPYFDYQVRSLENKLLDNLNKFDIIQSKIFMMNLLTHTTSSKKMIQ